MLTGTNNFLLQSLNWFTPSNSNACADVKWSLGMMPRPSGGEMGGAYEGDREWEVELTQTRDDVMWLCSEHVIVLKVWKITLLTKYTENSLIFFCFSHVKQSLCVNTQISGNPKQICTVNSDAQT